MATRTRRPARRSIGTRRKPARRSPKRTLTVTLGPTPTRSTRRKSHGAAWYLWRAARWGSRWAGRAGMWAGRRSARGVAGHYRRTRAAFNDWDDLRSRHPRGTLFVKDLFTGEAHAAHAAHLDLPIGGDWNIRDRQDEDAASVRDRLDKQRIDRMLSRPNRPPRWEQALEALRLRKIDRTPYRIARDARAGVYQQYRDRLDRDAALFAPPLAIRPAPQSVPATPHRTTRTQGDGSMANPIRDWNDLTDPGIDPFEFPTELPEHFTEVSTLLNGEAENIEGIAEEGKRHADIFSGYVDYLSSAEVTQGVVSPMSDANEEISTAAGLLAQAAEAMDRAATLAEQARGAAEAEYGDWQMPRFDRAG